MVDLTVAPFGKVLSHNLLCPDGERLYSTFISAEQVIEDIYGELIPVFRNDDLVTALTEVVGSSMDCTLQGIDCLAFFIRALGVAPRLIFKNQEETSGNCLTGTDLLNELEVVFLHEQTLFIGLLFHLLPNGIQMAVDLCPTCQYLDLQLDGADFQVGYKGIDDVPLFLGAAQHKIDGYYLDDLDIAVVLRVDDAVFNFGNRQIICYRVKAGGLRLLGADRAFYFALLGDLLFCLAAFFSLAGFCFFTGRSFWRIS